MMMMIRLGLWWSVMLMLCWLQLVVSGQQSYVNNRQLDCYNHYNTTDGFVCDSNDNDNDVASCPSFLTFRSIPPYNSPVSIAYLLRSDAARIAAANNLSSDVDPIPYNNLVLVPVNCSCVARRFYQHNASYALKAPSETYFSVANNTYQGLTTCQALMAQNSIGDRNLSVNSVLQIPLRCACPSPNQTASGVKYLLTYLVTWRDDISSIAPRFGVDSDSILHANMLSSSDIIFPFTPLLVPLTTEPSAIGLNQSPSPPPSPQTAPPPDGGQANSDSKKWIFVGVGTGAAVMLLLGLSAFMFCFSRRRTRSKSDATNENNPKAEPLPVSTSSDQDYSQLPDSKSTWSISSGGVRSAIESLTLYDIKEVQKATDFFSKANKIRGSVYRGNFKGDDAAVKVMKGDVSAEINILKRINHSNVIRLSGFCVHGGNTYLVYEYAESGSLYQCLQLQPNSSHSTTLTWKQRVEIAHDVGDALNYLHNFADPPYIHKNLKSSNILLDGNLRAKVSNFGLARIVGNSKDEGLQLTRHVVGTQGYLAPEYIENGVITPKMDVFAFGVVMLELLSGKEATRTNKNNENKEELLFDTIRRVLEGNNVREKLRGFIDPALRQDYPLDLAFSMAQLANSCVAQDLNSRPDIAQVFVTLSKIRSSTRDWDPSDKFHHSSSLTHAR